MRGLWLALTLMLLWPPSAPADFDAGFDAWTRKDFAAALREFRPLAHAGDVFAQFMIGSMYRDGEGVPQDKLEAVKWYRFAAEQGYDNAQFTLGAMYLDGEGVAKDHREALRWFHLAANQGSAYAQNSLGVMYARGEGVPEDYAQAYAWWNLAAAAGNEHAATNRDKIRTKMTPAQIARGQELSREIVQRTTHENSALNRPSSGRSDQTHRPTSELTAEVQRLLTELGYEPGPVDGVAGRQTAVAVRAFQSDTGMTQTGDISDELKAFLQAIVSAVSAQSAQPVSPRRRGSGSGFVVSEDGHVVTNRHVVDDCLRVTVSVAGDEQDPTATRHKRHYPVADPLGLLTQPKSAVVLATDQANDLALLKVAPTSLRPATLSELRMAALGESVAVAGFPLSGLLADELNVTAGTVSALAGLNNDARFIQISAPVQIGNSGGPLLNKSGHVIGVVVAKLDAAKVYKVTGDLPQNINFAIKGALVRGFLDIHGVNYKIDGTNTAIGGEAVAAQARGFVVAIDCWE